MQNVVLIIHLIIALLLIGAVLLQRSEGGALGIGGGGGAMMSGRSAATALQKATWALAAAFIVTSLTLTIFATQSARDEGLLDRTPVLEDPMDEAPTVPTLDSAPNLETAPNLEDPEPNTPPAD